MAFWPSSRGRVKEMSVRAVAAAETFCTTMSMLTSEPASTSKMRAASPTLSGTPTTVILASDRSWATPAMIACSTVSPSVSAVSGRIQVPSMVSKEVRTWIGTS
jgi:hypothetical protein